MRMISACALVVAGGAAALLAQAEVRPRARDLGLVPGVFDPGPLNAITDVAGVTVGHTTLVQGDNVRTGVTVVVPHAGNVFQDKVPGAVFVGNAFGKLAGSTQVDELGTIETPIALTNTLSVGAGTGTQAFGWKGGIGTASRKLPARYGGYTLGVLVQSNFGGVLTMGGAGRVSLAVAPVAR